MAGSSADRKTLHSDWDGAVRQSRDKLAASRVWLLKHKPFFGVLARAFRPLASDRTAGFRLWPDDTLWFQPLTVLRMTFPALCARLAHLSLHAALGAFSRRAEREPRRWNVAHDLAIEPLLQAAGLACGAVHGHFSALPAGASAEAYFEELGEDVQPEPIWCDLCDSAPDSDAVQPPPGGQSGDAAGSNGSDKEQGPPREAARGNKAVEEKGRELEWKLRLVAALEEEARSGGRTFGDQPAWIEEMLQARIRPAARWSAVLQRSLSSLQRSGRSFLRPSRRMSALVDEHKQWPSTVTMPGRRIEHAGLLAVVVDTSASIAVPMLERFLAEVVSVATAEGIDEIRLIQADAAVTSDSVLFAAELLFQPIAIVGRGGSDFAPALARLDADAVRQGRPFTAVYLSDLDGHHGSAPQHVDVLWVSPRRPKVAPPFGKVLLLDR